MNYRNVEKDAFIVAHYDNVLQRGTWALGSNLIKNGDFEKGDLSNWTATNFSAVDTSNVPEPNEDYGAKADESAVLHEAVISSLENSIPIAVTANAKYLISLMFGARRRTAPTGTRKPNNLVVKVEWWTATSGGSLIRTDTLRDAPVKPNNKNLRAWSAFITAPNTAAGMVLIVENRHFGGDTGTPDGTLIDDIVVQAEVIETQTQAIELLKHRNIAFANEPSFSDLKFEKSYRTGFKACSFVLRGEPPYLYEWLMYLGHEIRVRYDLTTCFEGMVWKIQGNIDGIGYGTDYTGIFNRINVPYGDETSKQYATVSDKKSRLRYGRKDFYETQNYDTEREAARRSNLLLRFYKDGLPIDDFNSMQNENALTITCIGYFSTLDFVKKLRSPFGSEQEMRKVIATGANSILNQVRALGNVFISNDYSLVKATGNEIGPFIPSENQEKSALEHITQWIDEGDDNGALLVSGVVENRQFRLEQRETMISYQVETHEGKLRYRDAGGAEIQPMLIDAGHFIRRSQSIPQFEHFNDAARNPRARFIAETSYDAERDELRLTMLGEQNLMKRVARLSRGKK